MNLRLHLLLPLCAALSLPCQSPATPTVRIGTWNLEFLGAEGNFRNNLPLRDEADYCKIGEKVKALGVQVLAVQEICGEAALAKVAAGAGPAWKFVLGTTGGWDDGKTSQQIGFLWDSDAVELLFAAEQLAFPREQEGVPIFHRIPVTAGFRLRTTGFDFRITTVHLKAGQKKPDEQKRRLEATALHGWLSALVNDKNEDQDIVLLGDFNSTFGAEPEAVLEQAGVLRYLEPSKRQPTIQHFDDPIDHVAIGPGFVEARAGSLTVHSDLGGLDKEAWRKIYSDHYPVTVDIDAANDNDPAATFARGDAAQSLPAKDRPAGAAPAVRGAGVWPPAVGTEITVYMVGGGPVAGRLANPLPEGPGGWIVLTTPSGTRAIPWIRVECVDVK